MLDAAYLKHLKVLGKICYIWDAASADVTAMKLMVSRLFDQTATGEVVSYDATKLVNSYTNGIDAAITSGPAALKAQMEQLASAYLTNTLFTDDLDTTPTDSTAKASLEALIEDMGDDEKTFDTAASTGFVNFFETVFAPTGSFPQSGTPTYDDSTYVILALA